MSKEIKFTKEQKKEFRDLKNKMFPDDTGTPHCVHCGKPFVNAYDSIAKKISEYLWKPDCRCFEDCKGFRLAMV